MREFSEWALVGSGLVLAWFTYALGAATNQLGRIQAARDRRDQEHPVFADKGTPEDSRPHLHGFDGTNLSKVHGGG